VSQDAREPLIGDGRRPDGVCPVCGQPRAPRASVCTRCGTRLLLDVPIRSASRLVSLGLVVGLVVGGGTVGAAWASQPPGVPPPGATPPASNDVGAVPSPSPDTQSRPAAVTAVLRNTGAVNARLAAAEAPLVSELERSQLDPGAISRILRRINVDLGATSSAMTSLAAWEETSGLGLRMGAYYGQLAEAVRTGLDASIRNKGAYHEAASRTVTLLQQLGTLEDERLALIGGVAGS
jgi:hypothetical protein